MNQLDAVNLILPKLGEHPVTNLNSRNPTLGVILPLFDKTIKDVIGPGWWFNTYDTTFAPDPKTGFIEVSKDMMTFVAAEHVTSIRGRRLHNSAANTFVWDGSVKGKAIDFVPFDELPESVASLVFYHVATLACVTDIGLTEEVRVWQSQIAPAYAIMQSEHLRNMRYSTTKSRRYSNLRRALRG